MAQVTITTIDAWIPEVFSTMTLENFSNNVVAAPLVDRRWERLLAPNGDRVNVPDIDNVTARTLTNMTGTVTFDAATETSTAIVVNTLAYFAFSVDSVSQMMSSLPLVEAYSEKAGIAVAIKVDTDVLANLDTTTSTTRGVDNVPVTDDVILQSRGDLDGNNNPHTERRLIVTPLTLQDMFKIERYTNSLYNASVGNFDTTKGRGYAGHVYDLDVYETTNLPAGTLGKRNFMFHKTGSALIMQKEFHVERRQAYNEIAQGVIGWAAYGVKLMRSGSIIEIDGR